MLKQKAIGIFALGAAMFALSVTVQAQTAPMASGAGSPPVIQIPAQGPSSPNMAMVRSTPQDYAEHMKALQQRKDVSNAILPAPPKTQGSASKTTPQITAPANSPASSKTTP